MESKCSSLWFLSLQIKKICTWTSADVKILVLKSAATITDKSISGLRKGLHGEKKRTGKGVPVFCMQEGIWGIGEEEGRLCLLDG